MKKKVLSFSIALISLLLFFLTSCTPNEFYRANKKVLDNNYQPNPHYGLLTRRGYKDENKEIDFEKVVRDKIVQDGKSVEWFYSTRYSQTLIDDTLYFCFEYWFDDDEDKGRYALGYVDFHTLDVYLDYVDYKRSRFIYNFSTDKFVCYTFIVEENGNEEKIDVVFFKDTNQLAFDYDLTKLVFEQTDIENPNLKEYYIEDGIKYILDDFKHTLTSTIDGSIITLPFENDILDKAAILKEMYGQFSCERISIYASYFSIGDELFFYIQDRPTNDLNVPFVLFKCNSDLSNVEYIGYCENSIVDVVLK